MRPFMMVVYVVLSVVSTAAKAVLPGPLVKAEWLVEHIDEVRVLDVRKDVDSFTQTGHIQGAVLVDVNGIRVDRIIDDKRLTRMRPDPAVFQTFMRDHGIDNDTWVVLSHRGETPGQVAGAARLYWHMKYYGFDNVALLDGGNRAWVDALEDLVNDSTDVQPGNYQVGAQRPEILATLQQVREAMDNPEVTLIDTRELRYHIGIDKRSYVYAYGHIPGSRLLPYRFLHPEKGTMVYYPTDKLSDVIDAMGIDMAHGLILYCNSAFECSSDWFVLHELLGHPSVRVYDGSLHQWTQYADAPMTTRLAH